ncbi:hypothetical protein E5D87_06410 [Helicobacter pylori]|nr:hypothetical protein E5D87_06410 [Helicobacter pylori]
MKFLAKWYLLFFIALSSLVFVGCDDSHPHSHKKTFMGDKVRNLELDYGFSHGFAVFTVTALFVLAVYLGRRGR